MKLIYKANTEEASKEELHQFDKTWGEKYPMVVQGIDITKFKEGLDIQKAVQIIFWTIEAFINKGWEMDDGSEGRKFQ